MLDVRTAAEWSAGHLPGAVNIPLGELPSRVGELPRGRPLVVHCQAGGRAAIAASLLQRAGRDGPSAVRRRVRRVERGRASDRERRGGVTRSCTLTPPTRRPPAVSRRAGARRRRRGRAAADRRPEARRADPRLHHLGRRARRVGTGGVHRRLRARDRGVRARLAADARRRRHLRPRQGHGARAVAATLGASAAFLVSRYVARGFVERRLAGNERFAAIDRAIGTEGRKIVLLLRLSPVFPFNLLNYALGLTRVRFADYLVASVGMLPGTLLYVYYGKVAGDVARLAGGAAVPRGRRTTSSWHWAGRHGGRDGARDAHCASRAPGGDRWRPWRRLTRDVRGVEATAGRGRPHRAVRPVQPGARRQRAPGRLDQPRAAGALPPRRDRRRHGRARHRVDRRRPRREGRAGRAPPDGRRLPQRGLRAVEGHHQRRPLVAGARQNRAAASAGRP